jgi:hypothetical protein
VAFFTLFPTKPPIVKLSVINHNLDTLVSRVGLTYFVLDFSKKQINKNKKRKKENFSYTSMVVGLEINTKKYTYTVM